MNKCAKTREILLALEKEFGMKIPRKVMRRIVINLTQLLVENEALLITNFGKFKAKPNGLILFTPSTTLIKKLYPDLPATIFSNYNER